MSKTYDPNLSTDKDWVRFKIGDRTASALLLEDQEIEELLAEEIQINGSGRHIKYLAAAQAGKLILNKGRGAVSKSVGSLSLSWSDNPEGAYGRYLDGLRERGAELMFRMNAAQGVWML